MKLYICKSKCEGFLAKSIPHKGRYISGQKWCKVCDVFLNFKKFVCPCCGCKLRTTPRNTKFRIKKQNANATSQV